MARKPKLTLKAKTPGPAKIARKTGVMPAAPAQVEPEPAAVAIPEMTDAQKKKASDDAELLALARKRFDAAAQAVYDNELEQADDLEFAAGNQWRPEDKTVRDADARPCLTVNKMGQYTRQITGDMRINKTAIKISPTDEGEADKELAEIMQGLIRDIEVSSNAQIAYIAGGKNAVLCGQGNWRVRSEYIADDSFEQHLVIDRIPNPFAVKWDPGAVKHTREDANYCFVSTRIPRMDFKEAFPDAAVTDFNGFETSSWNSNGQWINNDTVRIAEYWVKKPVTKKLAMNIDGETFDVTDLEDADIQAMAPKRVRPVHTYKICSYLISGAEVLGGPYEWPGRYIPIIPVWGEEINLGDTVKRFGLIRFAKDPQRMYNFHVSQAAETAALSPRTPWLVTVEMIRGQEENWQNVNKKSLPYLIYSPDPKMPGIAPQRQPGATLDVANLQLAQNAANDMQTVIGIYNASLSAPSNETSGKAINARDRQADVGTFEYIDNLAYGIAYTGKILVDVIPKFYDSERVIRVLGVDDVARYIRLMVKAGVNPDGSPRYANDLSAARYDVVAETGPSFSTRRQEAVESLMEFARVAPQAASLFMDIVAKNMTWPGAEQIAKRLKKFLPPGIDDEEGETQPPPPNPEAEAKAAKTVAETQKIAAETDKVRLENARAELELAVNAGALSGVINEGVADMLLRIIQGQLPPQGDPMAGAMPGLPPQGGPSLPALPAPGAAPPGGMPPGAI